MKTKQFIFLLLLTLLFLFTSSCGDDYDFDVAYDAHEKGDFKTAHRLFLPQAEQGHSLAQYNLGVMYQNGQGVPQDYKEAVKWYRLAAEPDQVNQGVTAAQYYLGWIYQNGQGVPQDYKEAVKWYRLAAEQGRFNLCGSITMYLKSENCVENKNISAKAQFELGAMYQNGLGVSQDYKEAVKWYRLSAEQGDPETQYILGTMYKDGRGVPQDYALAHMWFNLSGSNGNKQAVTNRGIVEKRMSPSQIEKAQDMARNWKPKK